MKELKDYAHLYLGCKAIITDDDGQEEKRFILNAYNLNYYRAYMADLKLILRPLSSITKEDIDLGDFIPDFEILIQKFTGGYCVELDSIQDYGYNLTIYPDGSMYCICKDNLENYPYKGGELFSQLLRKGFDLFDLRAANLAVYEEDLKTKE